MPGLLRAANALKTGWGALLTRGARRLGWTTTALGYPGYAAGGRARVLGRLLLAPSGTRPDARADVPGWRRLLTLEQPHAEVEVELGGERVQVRADDAGLVAATVDVVLPAGQHRARLLVPGRPPATALVHAAAPDATHGVVCDIDDTVWITGVSHPLRAAWRTFARNGSTRRPVTGMATLLTRLAAQAPDSPFVYLSNGPWNLAGPITAFLARHGFPPGAILLTDWGISRTAWFRSGPAHKRDVLEQLAADLPGVRWVLVGDDGEHDPEIYRSFAHAHPGHVAAIALRTVGPADTGPKATIGHVPVVRAADGAALATALRRAGVLPGA